MELKVYVDDLPRLISGISRRTTCQEVIYALAHATGKTGRFVLVEKWRTSERSLAPHDKPLELLLKWGEYAQDVQFVLRCLGDNQRSASRTSDGSRESEMGRVPRATSSSNIGLSPQAAAPMAENRRSMNFSEETLLAPGQGPWAKVGSSIASRNTGSLPRMKKQQQTNNSEPEVIYSIQAALKMADQKNIAGTVYNRKPVPPSPSLDRHAATPPRLPTPIPARTPPPPPLPSAPRRPPPPSYEETMRRRRRQQQPLVPKTASPSGAGTGDDFWPLPQLTTNDQDFRESLLATVRAQAQVLESQRSTMETLDKNIEAEMTKLNSLTSSFVDDVIERGKALDLIGRLEKDDQDQNRQQVTVSKFEPDDQVSNEKSSLKREFDQLKVELEELDQEIERKRQILSKLENFDLDDQDQKIKHDSKDDKLFTVDNELIKETTPGVWV